MAIVLQGRAEEAAEGAAAEALRTHEQDFDPAGAGVADDEGRLGLPNTCAGGGGGGVVFHASEARERKVYYGEGLVAFRFLTLLMVPDKHAPATLGGSLPSWSAMRLSRGLTTRVSPGSSTEGRE